MNEAKLGDCCNGPLANLFLKHDIPLIPVLPARVTYGSSVCLRTSSAIFICSNLLVISQSAFLLQCITLSPVIINQAPQAMF